MKKGRKELPSFLIILTVIQFRLTTTIRLPLIICHGYNSPCFCTQINFFQYTSKSKLYDTLKSGQDPMAISLFQATLVKFSLFLFTVSHIESSKTQQCFWLVLEFPWQCAYGIPSVMRRQKKKRYKYLRQGYCFLLSYLTVPGTKTHVLGIMRNSSCD